MDMEFEKVKSEMDSVEINTTAAREHVGEIERGIRTLKERCRCVLAGLRDLGLLYFHKWVVVHCLYHVTKMINSFPAKKGISAAWSPREIVTGRALDVSVDLRASFGALVDASYDKMVTNDMGDRTHPCIALGASGNIQGSLKCFDLRMGKVVLRRTFVERPMPARVLKLVNAWGKNPQGVLYGNKFEFRNRKNEEYGWDNEDLDVGTDIVDRDNPHPSIPAEIPGVELESDYESVVEAVQPAPIPSAATRAAATRANSDIGGTAGVAPAKIPGVDDVTEDAESSDDEDDGQDGDPKSPMGLPKLVKSKQDGDSSDSESNSDDEDFSGSSEFSDNISNISVRS